MRLRLRVKKLNIKPTSWIRVIGVAHPRQDSRSRSFHFGHFYTSIMVCFFCNFDQCRHLFPLSLYKKDCKKVELDMFVKVFLSILFTATYGHYGLYGPMFAYKCEWVYLFQRCISAGEEIPDYLERYERSLWNSLAVRNFWSNRPKLKFVLQPNSSPLKKEREIASWSRQMIFETFIYFLLQLNSDQTSARSEISKFIRLAVLPLTVSWNEIL